MINFPVDNDFGGMIINCDDCQGYSYVKIKNPAETYIRDGGRKVEYWDNEITSDQQILNQYINIQPLEQGIIINGEINKREISFNVNSMHIYHCHSCGDNIEKLVHDTLFENENEILNEYTPIMGNYNKGYIDGEYVIVKLAFTCMCGYKDEAFLYTDFDYGNFFTKEGISELLLIGTKNTIESTNLDRICSKSECIEMLEKFIVRWNFLFPTILIVTPFVGHQWMKEDQLLELWDWLLNTLDPKKTIFITRRATFNKYKKTFENKNGISLKFLEDYDLDNKVISNFTSKQDFHAKIFAGISNEKTEVLAGSFNLLKGKSFENLSYNKYSKSIFQNNFISKLNIPIEMKPLDNVDCILIYQESNKQFTSRQIKKIEIDKQLLNI